MIVGLLNMDYETYQKSIHEIYNRVRRMSRTGEIFCQICKHQVTMHGTYNRKVIFSEFNVATVSIVQVRCKNKNCQKVHAVIPAFVFPKKQYESDVIKNALKGCEQDCTADDSTIRRWRKHADVQK